MRPSRTLAATTLAATLALVACGTTSPSAGGSATDTATGDVVVDPNAAEVNPPGDIPDDQVFVTHDTGTFSVEVPEGWARSEANGTVSFTDKLNTVSLSSTATSSGPTVASARADEVPAIKSSQASVTVGEVTQVDRAGTTAIRIVYTRDGQADPVTGKTTREAVERYEFFRDGTEAIVTLSGPDGADNVDPWRIVSDSFAWG